MVPALGHPRGWNAAWEHLLSLPQAACSCVLSFSLSLSFPFHLCLSPCLLSSLTLSFFISLPLPLPPSPLHLPLCPSLSISLSRLSLSPFHYGTGRDSYIPPVPSLHLAGNLEGKSPVTTEIQKILCGLLLYLVFHF